MLYFPFSEASFVQEIPKATCPFCRARSILILDDAAPGDLGICMKCTGVSIFGDDMVPRPPLTNEEGRRVEYAVSNSLWTMLAAESPRS